MRLLSLLATILSLCLLHVASSPIPGNGPPPNSGYIDNSGIKNKIKDLLNVPENIVSHWKETTYDPIIKAKVQNLPYEAGMRAIRYNPLASAEKKAFNMFSKYKSTTPMKEWRQMLNMAREGKLDPSSAKAADSELQKAAQKLLVDKLGEKSGLLAKESWLKDFLAASEKIV